MLDKKKGLFFVKEDLTNTTGINKKILAQNKGFLENDLDIELVFFKENTRKIKDEVIYNFKNNLFGKLQKKYKYNDLYEYIKENKIDYLYIRYTHFSSIPFLKFLKKLKKNTNIIIHLEIPTYPYDSEKEIRLNYNSFFILEERLTRKYLKKYVDRVITFGKEEKIFGIKTIQLDNAIDIDSIKLSKEDKNEHNRKKINFIGVAGLAFWHGYDRMIKSVASYYKANNSVEILFHVVGDGEIRKELEELSEKLNVQDKVIFYGNKYEKELDDIFEKCQIGVDSLGRHRSGNNYNNSLKSKEYIARGIPLIKSHIDFSLKNLNFYYDVSSDENIFNLKDIIDWYFENNFEENKNSLRKYAEENLTWKIQMKKVLEEIK